MKVSIEIAKKLKKLGFDKKTRWLLDENQNLIESDCKDNFNYDWEEQCWVPLQDEDYLRMLKTQPNQWGEYPDINIERKNVGWFKYESCYSKKTMVSKETVSVPSQHKVVKWFRETHDIHIQPIYVDFEDAYYVRHTGYQLSIIFGRNQTNANSINYIMGDADLQLKYDGGIGQGHGIIFKTHEDTIDAGIEEAINYLLNKPKQ